MVDFREMLSRNEFDSIFNVLVGHGAFNGPVYRSPGELNGPALDFKNFITKHRTVLYEDNPDMQSIYRNVKDKFDQTTINFNVYFAKEAINGLVRPNSCDKSTDQNNVFGEEYFVRPILFLLCLLILKRKGMPESEFFTKKSGLFGSSVSLSDHLKKKRDEQGEPCTRLYTELLNVYNLVHGKTGGRRKTRSRRYKNRRKSRSSSSRSSSP
jgi:hypothetical protein